MLATVQLKTIIQIMHKHTQAWPLNFAACKLNRLKISLIFLGAEDMQKAARVLASDFREQFLFEGYRVPLAKQFSVALNLSLCSGAIHPASGE